MNILQQQHSAGGGLGRRRRRGQKKPAQILEGAITNLLGIIQDSMQVRAARKVQPHQMTDEMSGFGGFVRFLRTRMVARSQDADDPLFQFLPSHSRPIAVLNLKTEGENIAQERKG
jgi:hypothetical protein